MLKKKEVNMLSGSIVKGLLTIAFPIMIMNVLQSLFNIVDMTVLKTYDTDGMSVGAVGACGTLITLISNLVIGVATGANAVVAKHLGRRDTFHAERAAGTAFAFSIVAGVTLTVIGVSCAELFLSWVNCPDQLMSRAVLYFRLYFAGIPLLMVYNFCSASLRSSGNSAQIMKISITGGVVKLISTYLFVAVFRMGIPGVSAATIVSWLVYLLMGLYSVTRKDSAVRIQRCNIRFLKDELKAILHIGVPTGLQMGLYSIANVIIAATVNSFGPAATTGISIANTFDGVMYNVSHSASLAVLPYVSQNLGAGNVKRATESVWKGILVTVCIGGSLGALSAIFAPQLSSLMSDDATVIKYACQKMVLISSTYFICGINDVFSSALRGMGRPMVPTITTLIFMCAFRFFWVYVVFPLVPNLTFLYLVWPIGWIACIIIALVVFFPRVKQLKAQHPEVQHPEVQVCERLQ